MYKKGDYIHYGTNGLCKIEEITSLNMSGASQEKLYYRMTQVNRFGSTIYTPVDNPKVPMRLALTADEAQQLIDEIPIIEELEIPEERMREQKYRHALQSIDCRDWIQVIKTLNHRRKERLSCGRRVTTTDERYMHDAENLLYEELANALGQRKEDMEGYIANRLNLQR